MRFRHPQSKSYFIKGAIEHKGSLHKDLGIPQDKVIPSTLLERVSNAKVGETVVNPTNEGKPYVKVTEKVKKRAVLAKTLRGF